MKRRSFLKRAGLLSGLAMLNPLKLLELFKPKPALSMETMKAGFDQVYFTNPDPIKSFYLGPEEPCCWYKGTLDSDDTFKDISHRNGKQWIPMED